MSVHLASDRRRRGRKRKASVDAAPRAKRADGRTVLPLNSAFFRGLSEVCLNSNEPGQTPRPPAAVVDSIVAYYKKTHDDATRAGKRRKISHLGTAQSTLSRFKAWMVANGMPSTWTDELHLSPEQTAELEKQREKNMHAGAIDLPTIHGEQIIRKCREYLLSEDPYFQIIGLAGLTGRRMAELAKTMQFNPAQEEHHTNEKYWANVTGILKQRGPAPLVSIEIPIFAPLSEIQAAVRSLRAKKPIRWIEEVNSEYSVEVSRRMRRYCSVIGKLHQFRKFYVLMCEQYFNERDCAQWRVAHDYLGHKSINTHVLTYLNFKVSSDKSLDFGRGRMYGRTHPSKVAADQHRAALSNASGSDGEEANGHHRRRRSNGGGPGSSGGSPLAHHPHHHTGAGGGGGGGGGRPPLHPGGNQSPRLAPMPSPRMFEIPR